MAKKFYAVKEGRVPGIYQSWEECKAQVDGYSGAVYKGFSTDAEALAFVTGTQQEGTVQQEEKLPQRENVHQGENLQQRENLRSLGSSELTAYVDGSYHSGTGEFSYGVVILQNGEEICFQKKISDPDLAAMHNVAGEIKGAEVAMRYALENGYQEIHIYHDYEGIAKWCIGGANGWKANKPGTQAYKAYYESICDRLQVHFHKVKGHSGDKYNDMADRLAKEALGISS